jgi:hypothetical protein
MTNEEDNELI